MNIQDVRNVLYQIEELAGKSQGLWDNSWTNAVIADHPDKARFTQQTYQATRIHAECMTVLRALLTALQDEAEQQADDVREFAADVKAGRVIWRN